MQKLSLQLNLPDQGWTTCCYLGFPTTSSMTFEYDLDYASQFFGESGVKAVSINLPVSMEPFRRALFPFVLDLIPQGEPLRRLLSRYQITSDQNYYEILRNVPLAPPGNIRVLEPWQEFTRTQKSSSHQGFTRADIVKYQKDFVDYMLQVGAPIGGTSGAGGGSPKYVMREDHRGQLHAEGILPDDQTKRSFIVKFPYTDSSNSIALAHTEKAYHDILRKLQIKVGPPIEIEENVLFIPRFDRRTHSNRTMEYFGLESFYSANQVALHGAMQSHEQNLAIIEQVCAAPHEDILEYVKRDIVNQLLANTDNHGRNWSLLKIGSKTHLSPMYDVTAMKFFSEPILELTKWSKDHQAIKDRMQWLQKTFRIPFETILEHLRELYGCAVHLDDMLEAHHVPRDFIERSRVVRQEVMKELKSAI